jgi:serine/threonine-protein kinase
MAKLLVRKQSRSATSVEELISELTSHIPSESERSKFKKTLEHSGISSASMVVAASTPSSPAEAPTQIAKENLSATARQQITRLLAFHVGPLAGRIIQKAMQTTLEPHSLIVQLAQQITDERDRQEFIDQASRLI